mmetsp:Transcript_114047/g.271516  ORF Transcript_114047/g.271516 Transcript_114047/m.271516 type:complete len:255 (+) Transcript_114047:2562-3326(+)
MLLLILRVSRSTVCNTQVQLRSKVSQPSGLEAEGDLRGTDRFAGATFCPGDHVHNVAASALNDLRDCLLVLRLALCTSRRLRLCLCRLCLLRLCGRIVLGRRLGLGRLSCLGSFGRFLCRAGRGVLLHQFDAHNLAIATAAAEIRLNHLSAQRELCRERAGVLNGKLPAGRLPEENRTEVHHRLRISILRCDCEDRLLGGAPQGEIDAACLGQNGEGGNDILAHLWDEPKRNVPGHTGRHAPWRYKLNLEEVLH